MPATKPVAFETTPTDPLPALSADLYARLRDSIADRGILVPVLRDVGGEVLDGRQRMRVAEELGIRDVPTIFLSQLSEDDRNDIRISTNAYRRHLTRSQLQSLVEWELEKTPSDSDRKIAGRIGVSHRTVAAARARGQVVQVDYRTGKDNKRYPAARPSVFTRSSSQGKTVARQLAYLGEDAPRRTLSPRDVRHLVGEKERAELHARSRSRTLPDEFLVSCCDFRNHGIPDGSADFAYGDPPWLSGWSRHRGDYARAVYDVLKPGSYFAAYTGHMNLYEWMKVIVDAGFIQRWMIAMINAGGGGSIRERGTIRTSWRPCVLFQKPGGAFRSPHTLRDVLKTHDRGKSHHEWEQPLEEGCELVRCLSRPSNLVVDLTAGSGTSGVACAAVGGRRYHGVEIRRDLCRLARRRISDALAGR